MSDRYELRTVTADSPLASICLAYIDRTDRSGFVNPLFTQEQATFLASVVLGQGNGRLYFDSDHRVWRYEDIANGSETFYYPIYTEEIGIVYAIGGENQWPWILVGNPLRRICVTLGRRDDPTQSPVYTGWTPHTTFADFGTVLFEREVVRQIVFDQMEADERGDHAVTIKFNGVGYRAIYPAYSDADQRSETIYHPIQTYIGRLYPIGWDWAWREQPDCVADAA